MTLDQAIEADLAQIAIVWRCDTRDALLDPIVARQVDAAVVSLLDQAGTSVATFIAEVRKRNPRVRIVVDMPATPAAFQQVPAALQAGAAAVAIRGYDRLAEVVRTVLAPDWQPGAERALLEVLSGMVPEDLEAFAIVCALKGSPRLTVELAAKWVGMSARTVEDRLRRASLAPPIAFIRYCSAAHAMCLLYPQRLPPDRVVERMRFGSKRALRDLMQDHADPSADEMHERWRYAALLLRPGEFLRRPPVRQAPDIELDLERLERYAQGDLPVGERIDFERRIAGTPLTRAGEILEDIRRWSAVRGLERDQRQRQEETWARLLRSVSRDR